MLQLGFRSKVVAAALAGVFGIVVGLTVAVWWTSRRPISPLTENLGHTWAIASSHFDTRIRRRFPIGTAVTKLASELAAEGFVPTWFEENGEHVAVRNEGDFVCNIVAQVYWRADKDDKILSIRGVYRELGCL
ncbi:hypothetical protein SAMN05444678_10695 [Sphingomonas sp. YR710]|uniref:hypothetical protein n=1 Tax=Sphingomonas sp. YR710 TaxID=1882773 RepID=UPI00088CDF07|nr:hypothetical protein [Sphingomonas sp. YR710]SDC84674.1 hypothetical protein SAMN05444678_10695 [Sphingomonas sp. YR710]